ERLLEPQREGRPLRARNAVDRNRAVCPVQWAGEIEVPFELAEVRQDAVPAPSVGPERRPFVIVLGRAAIGYLAIDGRAAADQARLLIDPAGGLRRIVLERSGG